MAGTDLELLRRQRRGALITEIICFSVALIAPAIAYYFLHDKLAKITQIPAALWAPLIPVVLLTLAGIGFHRHRKGIERKLRAATQGSGDPR